MAFKSAVPRYAITLPILGSNRPAWIPAMASARGRQNAWSKACFFLQPNYPDFCTWLTGDLPEFSPRAKSATTPGLTGGDKIPAEQRHQGAKKVGVRWRKDKKKSEEPGESTIQSEPTGLTSEDTRILDLLTRVVQSARRRNMVPPF